MAATVVPSHADFLYPSQLNCILSPFEDNDCIYFYNNCLNSRALIGSGLWSMRV